MRSLFIYAIVPGNDVILKELKMIYHYFIIIVFEVLLAENN